MEKLTSSIPSGIGISATFSPEFVGEHIQPAIGEDGTIHSAVFGTDNLFALDTDGKVKWDFQTDGPIYTDPMMGTNGTIFIGTGNKKMYAINGSGGPARTPWPMNRRDQSHTGRDSATILDPNLPSQLAFDLSAGILINGNIGKSCRVEFVEKISDFWSPLATITLDRAPYLFIDIQSTNALKRFYRAVQLP